MTDRPDTIPDTGFGVSGSIYSRRFSILFFIPPPHPPAAFFLRGTLLSIVLDIIIVGRRVIIYIRVHAEANDDDDDGDNVDVYYYYYYYDYLYERERVKTEDACVLIRLIFIYYTGRGIIVAFPGAGQLLLLIL